MKAKVETQMKVIVIATAGHVFIGNVTRMDLTTFGIGISLTDASVIRVWGTTRGLGEIALGGPTKETILDPIGDIDVPLNAIISVVKCLK